MRQADDIHTASGLGLCITVNGQPYTMAVQCTLADLLTEIGHAPESIATALNGEFIPRAQRDLQALRSGDKVTCFQAITGG